MSAPSKFKIAALRCLIVNDTCYQAASHYRTMTTLQPDCSHGQSLPGLCNVYVAAALGSAPVPVVWPA